MSSKRLLPLIVLLGVLIIVVMQRKWRPAPADLADEVGLERILPDALRLDLIRGLDLYQGATPEIAVRLRRQGSAWVVESYHNAPAQASRIDAFLGLLSTLQGERRAEQAELLGDFQLEAQQALHVHLYRQKPEAAEIHLLAGKSQGAQSFVRRADNNRVYTVNWNVHSRVGLREAAADQPPPVKPWLDLRMRTMPQEQVTQVALHTPGQRWLLVRQTPSPTADETVSGNPKATPAWTLTDPTVDYPLQQGRANRLIDTLCTLYADDIADPAQVATYGLVDSPYRAVLTTSPDSPGAREVILWVGGNVPAQVGKHYARIGTEGPVYILPIGTFEGLFPKGKELLRLPTLARREADIRQITLHSATRTVRFTRSSGSNQTTPWVLTSPPMALTVQQDGVTALAHRLATFIPDDVLTTGYPAPALLPDVTPRVELTLQDGSRHALRLGPPLTARPNQYPLILQAPEGLFTIDEETRHGLFPALRTLVHLQVLAIPVQEVTRLTWQIDGRTRRLERRLPASAHTAKTSETAAWQWVENPHRTVNQALVSTLLTILTEFMADDWIEQPAPSSEPESPTLTLSLMLADGQTKRLMLSKTQTQHYVRLQETPGVWVLPVATHTAVLGTLGAMVQIDDPPSTTKQ